MLTEQQKKSEAYWDLMEAEMLSLHRRSIVLNEWTYHFMHHYLHSTGTCDYANGAICNHPVVNAPYCLVAFQPNCTGYRRKK